MAAQRRKSVLEELAGPVVTSQPESANNAIGNSILSLQQRGGQLAAAVQRGAGTIGQTLGTTIGTLQKQRQKKGLLSL